MLKKSDYKKAKELEKRITKLEEFFKGYNPETDTLVLKNVRPSKYYGVPGFISFEIDKDSSKEIVNYFNKQIDELKDEFETLVKE